MKELSIEQKAKRYDEALERARQINSEGQAQCADVMTKVFPELKESKNESIVRDIRVVLESSATRFFKENGKMPVWYDRAVAWLEKQGEQKPFDYENANIPQKDFAPKVEPKFKVGDWIACPAFISAPHMLQVIDIKDGVYKLEDVDGDKKLSTIGYTESIYYPWTIQDARDGDVLASESWIFIYGGLDDMNSILYKFLINEDGEDLLPYKIGCNNTGIGDIRDNRDVHPATKEQRDLLFQRMKEEGYEWHAIEKELIKLQDLSPKPKESKDKKIRKGIIKTLMDLNADWIVLHGVTKKDAIAWLEKQG